MTCENLTVDVCDHRVGRNGSGSQVLGNRIGNDHIGVRAVVSPQVADARNGGHSPEDEIRKRKVSNGLQNARDLHKITAADGAMIMRARTVGIFAGR